MQTKVVFTLTIGVSVGVLLALYASPAVAQQRNAVRPTSASAELLSLWRRSEVLSDRYVVPEGGVLVITSVVFYARAAGFSFTRGGTMVDAGYETTTRIIGGGRHAAPIVLRAGDGFQANFCYVVGYKFTAAEFARE